MPDPVCSVVIPTYNRLDYLARAIASVAAQSFERWELLVVDDGSSDGSGAMVAALAAKDARIRLLSNGSRPGPAGARNTGIRAATCHHVAFLDSDDLWEPDKLERFVEAAGREPDAVLVGSDYRMVDHAGGGVTAMRDILHGTMLPWWERYDKTAALLPCAALRQGLMMGDRDVLLSMTIGGFLWIHTSSAMVRRDAVLGIGGFDESLLRTEDMDLWLRLSRKGPFVFIDEQLALHDTTGREHADGGRYQGHDPSRRHSEYLELQAHLLLMQRIGDRFELSPAQRALLGDRFLYFHGNCASAAWRAGDRRRWLAHRAARFWWTLRGARP